MKERGKNFTGLQSFWSDIAVVMVLSLVIIAFLATETGLKGQCHTICCLFRKPKIIVQFSYLRLHLGIETLFSAVCRYKWQGWTWIKT